MGGRACMAGSVARGGCCTRAPPVQHFMRKQPLHSAGTSPACRDRSVREVGRVREQGWRPVAHGKMWGNWASR